MARARLQLGTSILFTNPQNRDWRHARHRDFDTENLDLSPAEEMEMINQRRKDPRWHLALVDDACLQLVPASHKRYRNKAEHECPTSKCHEDLPEQPTIARKAGQAVCWDTYTIHRGAMKKEGERLCLNCDWNLHQEDAPPQETAAVAPCTMRYARSHQQLCAPITTAGAPCNWGRDIAPAKHLPLVPGRQRKSKYRR